MGFRGVPGKTEAVCSFTLGVTGPHKGFVTLCASCCLLLPLTRAPEAGITPVLEAIRTLSLKSGYCSGLEVAPIPKKIQCLGLTFTI